MYNLISITEGLGMFIRRIKVAFKGFESYNGDIEKISHSIIKRCWNEKFFQVSGGHFSLFYIRDFSWVIHSLLELGYKTEVKKTIEFALRSYISKGKVTVAITKKGIPFDFPRFAVDSLPSLIRSIKIARYKLTKEEKEFIEAEAKLFYDKVIDKKTGLVNENHFSSIKDHHIRESSCYDTSMVGMLSVDLKELKIKSPFKKDYSKILKKKYWTGTYFKDQLNKDTITGDANLFPFWTGIIKDKNILKKSINSIKKEGLDSPFPLKYSKENLRPRIFASIFALNYEGSAIWAHMGPLYLSLVKSIDKTLYRKYLSKYKEKIKKEKNFLEVYTKKGKPYLTPFYAVDESMIWVANILLEVENEKRNQKGNKARRKDGKTLSSSKKKSTKQK